MLVFTNNKVKLKRKKKRVDWSNIRGVLLPGARTYDKITAIVNKTRVRDQEEKNKIFNIY